ncbi:hypothetical protein K458DRAFT_358410 [Lentithecium fluviatile CBS 122367]|uniref:Uncharacterized protein n=1 Tax=Lentithecium fluviatile CBS 122367 TaxID=1168545 RepID=A0A6G1JHD1_9PLEO|nr:hypothetical protein K458DRAFT_358410 [Lentithecium fluviatile CBS 122367]
MPLRKRHTTAQTAEGQAGKAEETKKKGKRQRLAAFFRSRKQKKAEDKDAAPIPVPTAKDTPRTPARDSKIAESTKPAKSSSSIEVHNAGVEKEEQQAPPSTPPPEPLEKQEEAKVEPLSEDHIHSLFSGAPHFFVKQTNGRPTPRASYPWDEELRIRDVSDSVQLAQPAFSATTLHRHLPTLHQSTDQERVYQGYNLDVVEVPSMLSAQGTEVGTIGFEHFLELPRSDNLVTDLQQSQTSNEYLEAVRNKELMQTKPERLGIRSVDMAMVYDRLVELGDLFEAFHDSPERITILNNQTSGDLYANLFGKFLTPPPYDGSVDDPTGMKVQIDTLLKILRLKGVWVDFSLVEWRIRLGQILWSDQDTEIEYDAQIWTEREKLLFQITLACELLLRLDAVTSMDADDVKAQMHVTPQDFQGFLNLKTRKTDWDLVLARRFLENIVVVKDSQVDVSTPNQTSRGLLSLLGSSAPKEPKETLRADVVLLPQHQSRQLSGLLHFAQTVQWPGLDNIFKELAKKLGATETIAEPEESPSPHGKFLDPSTPSSISVYGTPLATPRSNVLRDSYFGHLEKPVLSRTNSRSLQIPLSTTLLAHADSSEHVLNVGGWLSRSYLTGLILPGEPISHFLMSTLLENDKLAIATLGDSANLYGGFIYAGRTWWSKASVVGRVLGCVDGAVESMGWVTFAKLPESLPDGWYAISSDQLRPEQQPRISAKEDLVLRDSTIIPGMVGDVPPVNPGDLTLPHDADTPPIPSVEFIRWDLTSINPGLAENDASSSPSLGVETFVASITFKSYAREKRHVFSLTHDVQFVTSWPCTPPSSSPAPGLPHILKRAQTQTLTRTSSKRSIHSMRSASNRSSRHLSRRNSHGFEPLLSHPPESPGLGPTRMYFPEPDEVPRLSPSPRPEPMNAHPLHDSYRYKLVPATDVLDPNFILPFTMHAYASPAPSAPNSPREEKNESTAPEDTKSVLVLDTRASKDLELLARSWCAEKGLHAIIGRVGRTCLACCIREARGLGINVVIRV